MTVLQIVLLGIVQGFTEFLPVSSSAHLVFVQSWMKVPESEALPLDVFLHLGTLAAAAWLFRREMAALVRGGVGLMGRGRSDPEDRRLLVAVVVATVPAAAVGVIFHGAVERAFSEPREAAMLLVVTGVVLLSTRFAPRGARPVDLPRALGIGLAQAISILPGISRSGSTIATGIWLGSDRVKAARFSFLMSIPIILGAAAVEIPHVIHPSGPMPHPAVLAAGFVASLVSGVVAIRLLLRVVGRGRFEFFGVYCLAFAAFVLLHK